MYGWTRLNWLNWLNWPTRKKSLRSVQEYAAFLLVVGLSAKGLQFLASFI
jgi:hypothetical protein